MKFKIKTKRLENMIKHVVLKKMKGKNNLIESFIIKAGKDSLQVRRADTTQVVFVEVIEKEVKVFTEGELPIGDIDEFMKFLNLMGKEVTISYNGMQVVMTDGTNTAKFLPVAQEIEHMEGEVYRITDDGFVETPGGKLETSFEVNAAQLKNVVKNADVVGVNIFPIKVQEGKLEVSVGKPESDMIDTRLSLADFRGQPAEAEYGMGFDNVFSNIDGLVRLAMSDDAPLFIEKIDKNFTFHAIMAPVVENRDFVTDEEEE